MSEDLPDTKVCLGVCGKELPLEAFGKFKEGRYGRRAHCNECRAQEEKDRRVANPLTETQREEARIRARLWNKENPERKAASSKAWAEENPEASRSILRRYRSKPEVRGKLRESYRIWLRSNPDKAKAASRRWRKANPDKVRELYTKWVESNRDHVRELNKKWNAEHPEHSRRRYLAIQNSDFTFDQWLELLDEFSHQCAYCGRSDVPLTMDHRVAIVNGGIHTKSNIVPACRSCNSKKGSKDPSLFKIVVQRANASK